MGNHSYKEYGGIKIKIDNKLEYLAGETMSGQVFLDIRKPFPGNAIMLHIKGREKVHWEFEETVNENNAVNDALNQNQNNYTVYQIIHYGKHHFYNNSVLLYQFNGQYIQEGQYCFPFSFVLQQNLPPSFFYNQGTDFARCEYRLYAKLHGFDSKIHFKHYENFIIKSSLLNMPQTIVQDNKSDLVTCCCSNKGQAVLRCMFDKNAYIPGEQAKIFLEVENQNGQVDINEIDCEFKQQLTLRAHKVKKRVKFSDAWLNTGYVPTGSNTKNFNKVVGRSNAQGVKVGENQRTITFTIDQNLYHQPTFTSEWIKNTYSMKVFCNIDGCTCMACGGCCGKFPQVEIPISVASAPSYQLQMIQQQQQQFEQQINMQYQNHWNPQMFPNAQIIFDNNNFIKTDTQSQMYNYNYNFNMNMQGMANNNMMQQQQPQQQYQGQQNMYNQNYNQQQQMQQPLLQNQQYNQGYNLNVNQQQNQNQMNIDVNFQQQQNNYNYQQQNQM